jgi:hydroxymethylpyrimidine/phosphomethylpyrimidine kinase
VVKGRILIVAGSDSGGGAGIQADIKTVTALGGYASTAVTALTAQNTRGVYGVIPTEPDFVRLQMRLVLEDIGADVIKTGMLHDEQTIDAVADELEASGRGARLVVDPVMVAKGGAPLLDPDAVAALKRRIVNLAAVITPNLPEAEHLAGMSIRNIDDMKHAASAMLTLGCEAVLLKGGHLDADIVTDVLATASGLDLFEAPRIQSGSTHGTGCTLASAIATGLAQGMTLKHAVQRARAFVRAAIEAAPGLGHGHGPLNHAHAIPPYLPHET